MIRKGTPPIPIVRGKEKSFLSLWWDLFILLKSFFNLTILHSHSGVCYMALWLSKSRGSIRPNAGSTRDSYNHGGGGGSRGDISTSSYCLSSNLLSEGVEDRKRK